MIYVMSTKKCVAHDVAILWGKSTYPKRTTRRKLAFATITNAQIITPRRSFTPFCGMQYCHRHFECTIVSMTLKHRSHRIRQLPQHTWFSRKESSGSHETWGDWIKLCWKNILFQRRKKSIEEDIGSEFSQQNTCSGKIF